MSGEQPSRDELADAYSQVLTAAVGMPASAGRIFAALLTSSTPLSQADLRSLLSLSDGSVSEGLQLLAAHDLVQRSGDPRARPAFFEVCPGAWATASVSTLQNVKDTYDLALLTLKHLEAQGVEGHSRAFALSFLAMYEVLADELEPVIQRALEAADREWAKHHP